MEMEVVRCLRADVSGSRTESEKGQERDTRMCGDPKMWFPMRVTYQREMKVKAELDRQGIENFVPMRYTDDKRGYILRSVNKGTERQTNAMLKYLTRLCSRLGISQENKI